MTLDQIKTADDLAAWVRQENQKVADEANAKLEAAGGLDGLLADFDYEAYAKGTMEPTTFENSAISVEQVMQIADDLGIDLVVRTGDDRFRIADIGFGTSPTYLSSLVDRNLLPAYVLEGRRKGKGYETHRTVNENGATYTAISFNEEDVSGLERVVKTVAPVALSLLVPQIAPALAASLGVTNAVASGLISAGIEAAQGGDFQDILEKGLISYGIADAGNIAGKLYDTLPRDVQMQIADVINPVGEGANAALTDPNIINLVQNAVTNPESGGLPGFIKDMVAAGRPMWEVYQAIDDFEQQNPGTILDYPGTTTIDDGGSQTGGSPSPAPAPAPEPPEVDTAPPADPAEPVVPEAPAGPSGGETGDIETNPETGGAWVYVGNGKFINTETGEGYESPPHPDYGYDNAKTVVGGRYDFPEVEYKDAPQEEPSAGDFDFGGFWGWVNGGSGSGYDYTGDSTGDNAGTTGGNAGTVGGGNQPSGGNPSTSGSGNDPDGGTGPTTGDGNLDGNGDGNVPGDGPGDGVSAESDFEFRPELLLGLLPLLQQEKEKKTYEGKAVPQDMSTLYEKPTYDPVTQKERLSVPPMPLQEPSIRPAANSGQDSFEQWYEDFLKSEEAQKGLLPMIAPKRKSRGLI